MSKADIIGWILNSVLILISYVIGVLVGKKKYGEKPKPDKKIIGFQRHFEK